MVSSKCSYSLYPCCRATSLHALIPPCAAIVARIASAPEQWHAVSVTIRGAALISDQIKGGSAGVLVSGVLVGLILPRLRVQRRNRWGEL